MDRMDEDKIFCSFCGKDYKRVEQMICDSTETVYVCDECVECSFEVINKKRKELTMENFYELLPSLLKETVPMEHPNNTTVSQSDFKIGVLEDELAKKLWTLKQKYKKICLMAYIDDEKIPSAIAKFRYKICEALFLNRIAEIMELFGKENIKMRSNWEIVVSIF